MPIGYISYCLTHFTTPNHHAPSEMVVIDSVLVQNQSYYRVYTGTVHNLQPVSDKLNTELNQRPYRSMFSFNYAARA